MTLLKPYSLLSLVLGGWASREWEDRTMTDKEKTFARQRLYHCEISPVLFTFYFETGSH